MEIAVNSGAEDVDVDEQGSIEVITAPEDFLTVKEALIKDGFDAAVAEVSMVPQNYCDLDHETAEKVL